MIEDTLYAWDNIDRILTPEQIKTFLDSGRDVLNFSKEQYVRYLMTRPDSFNGLGLNLSNSEQILDLGCGLGDDTIELKVLAGENCSVTGVDISNILINEARERIKHFQYDINVEVADAHQLSFDDNRFDLSCSRRVFQHLKEPDKALKEMIRVTKPGGRILLIEPDRGSMLLDSKNMELTRTICSHIENVVRNPWMGRQLYSLFRANGLKNIQVQALSKLDSDLSVVDSNYGVQIALNHLVSTQKISTNEATEWFNDLQKKNKAQSFFCAASIFVAIAYK